MRKHTDPGAPAPPAPGSVCAPAPPGVVPGTRRLTPGAGAYTSEDDTPTKPDNQLQPELLELVQIVDSMPPVERRRFIAHSRSYRNCTLGRRVLLEEMSRELAGLKT